MTFGPNWIHICRCLSEPGDDVALLNAACVAEARAQQAVTDAVAAFGFPSAQVTVAQAVLDAAREARTLAFNSTGGIANRGH